MHYDAFISREGRHVLAALPDCPGCQTFADTGDEIAEAAREALDANAQTDSRNPAWAPNGFRPTR